MNTSADGWNWREILAQTAYRTGVQKLLGRLSQKYEVHLSPEHRLPVFRRAKLPKYAILCYHRVGTEGIPYYSTLPPAQFESQMRFLRENFRVISLGQLCDELKNPGRKGHGVAVTFDDGYSDLYVYALPILRKFEIPATVYLTTDCIETGEVAWYDKIFLALQVAKGTEIELPIGEGPRFALGSPQQRVDVGARIVLALRLAPAAERERVCAALTQQVSLPEEKLAGRMLSWRQVHEMRSAGISFGSHTLSHPVLRHLSSEEIFKELGESKKILEKRLGEPVVDFAFPFGKPEDYGPIARGAVSQCGYRSAVTTVWGVNCQGADMYALRRLRLGDERNAAKFGLQLHREFLQVSEPSASQVLVAQGGSGIHGGSPALVSRQTDA
jgi:peptidoglycan/xylan/chitin deacetylase (PgdA/CDA1 family)